MLHTVGPGITWRRACGLPSLIIVGPAVLSAFLGCGTHAEMPLAVSDASVNVGVFNYAVNDGRKVEHAFQLRVWKRCPVFIMDIQVDCGCTAVDKELIGKELTPGSVHTLRLRVNPQGKAGVFKSHTLLRTEPKSPEPLVLSLQAFIAPRPVVSPERLLVEAELGADVRRRLTVSRLRDVRTSPTVLDRTRCDFGTFLVTEREATVEKRSGGGVEAVVDRLELDVTSSQRLPIGEYESELRLSWQGGLEPSVIPVVLRVVHPMRAQVDRLFCGPVKPRGRRRIELGVTARGPVSSPLDRVECDLDFVTLEVNERRNGVVLEIDAPAQSGRFSGTVNLLFTGSVSVPPLAVPIAVMVAE